MAVFAPIIGAIWEIAEEFGVDRQELFREAGIDPALRLDINARISQQQLDDLLWMAWQRSGDDAFVFKVADSMHPSYLGAAGYAFLTSISLRKAFERLQRYSRMLSDEMVLTLRDEGQEFQIIMATRGMNEHNRALRERQRVASAVKLIRMNTSESFHPERVQFTHSIPENVSAYYSFFRCELQFDAQETLLAITSELADAPLPGFNPQIVQINEQLIIDYLAKLDRNDVVGRSKSIILEQLPSGEVSAESVAEVLNLSPRTYRRKLHAKQTSFKEMLAQTRRELGEKYILDSSLTLTEISFLLGFSDTSSFSRAFRNWTGQSPSARRASRNESPQSR